MSLPTPLLSKTVQSLSKTKVSELARLRQTYESRKDEILESAKSSSDSHERLKVLLAGVKALKPPSAPGHESIENIERWLAQSVYDSSIPEDLLAKLEGQLREKLELQAKVAFAKCSFPKALQRCRAASGFGTCRGRRHWFSLVSAARAARLVSSRGNNRLQPDAPARSGPRTCDDSMSAGTPRCSGRQDIAALPASRGRALATCASCLGRVECGIPPGEVFAKTVHLEAPANRGGIGAVRQRDTSLPGHSGLHAMMHFGCLRCD